jgi:phosphoribosylamine--glycine ligase
VEVAVGAFFNGKEWALPINVNFEHKKLFPGELGPSTGEMGTSMFWTQPNRLFNQTLKKMEGKLAEERFVGYVDLNCIVNANGIYPLEFTSRFGYPTIFIQQEGMTTPISEVLHGLAEGTLNRFKTKSGFQVGVRVIVPPYPFDDEGTFESVSKNAVILFKKPPAEEVHIEDTKLVDGEWLVAGTSGVVLTVVGLGSTMKQAQAQAYSRVRNIMIPNMYYRTDIGDRWAEDSDRLHNWGYLREV